jgi:hypothetical protein
MITLKNTALNTGLFLLLLINGISSGQQTETYFKPGVEPNGFRGIEWGQSFDSVPDMEFIKTEPSDGDISVYSRKNDRLQIGYVELEKIEYCFWKNRFYKAVIYTKGFGNWKGLQESTFERFGRGFQPESKKEEYAWFGNKARMILIYDDETTQGVLTIFSKEISVLQQQHDW